MLGGSKLAVEAASYYVVAYVVTTLAAFAVISLLSSDGGEEKTVGDRPHRVVLASAIISRNFIALAVVSRRNTP